MRNAIRGEGVYRRVNIFTDLILQTDYRRTADSDSNICLVAKSGMIVQFCLFFINLLNYQQYKKCKHLIKRKVLCRKGYTFGLKQNSMFNVDYMKMCDFTIQKICQYCTRLRLCTFCCCFFGRERGYLTVEMYKLLPVAGRMLPVWLLVVPTVTHGIMQYLIGNAVSTITSQALRRYHRQDQQKQV